MAFLITFKTAKFDPSAEPDNDLNAIAGQSVLVWLKESVFSEDFDSTDPAPEDWGWYIDLAAGDDRYMIGAICYWESGDPVSESVDWLVQFHKSRSLKDRILGRAKLEESDPVFLKVLGAFQGSADFEDVRWQADA